MQRSWMLYGATGYTGTLIAEEAVRRGHKPILAGRNAEKLRVLAERLKLEWMAFPFDDADSLCKAAKLVDLILHAGGHFDKTCEPMMDACLAGKTHYLDISNEITVVQAAQARHRQALEQSILLIPGIGFGTVASNCLARYLCERIASPVSLDIIISPYIANKSTGAAQSTLETISRGAYVRRKGVLVSTPLGTGATRIRIGNSEHSVLPVPSGDLEAAYLATGISNINVYMTVPLHPIVARLLLPLVQKTLSWHALRKQLNKWLNGRASNTVKAVDTARHSWVWAQVTGHTGETAEATLETGEGYYFTASACILAVEQVLKQRLAGAMTPATAFGADFVLQIKDASRLTSPTG